MSRDEVKGREHLVARQKALTAVFKRFASVWPRAFASGTWDTIMDTWQDQLGQVDTDVLEQAAREYLKAGSHQYPPKPWDFAKFARTVQDKRPGMATRVFSAPVESPSVFAKARPMWFAKPGADIGYGRLDAERAIAFAITRGGTLNICEFEMDQIYAHELGWGWMEPAQVPRMAAPDEFFTSWGLNPKQEDAA